MAETIDIDTAKTASGLRLVLTQMPGAPWTEAAKAVFEVKGVPYRRVAQQAGQTDAALKAWTGMSTRRSRCTRTSARATAGSRSCSSPSAWRRSRG